MSDPMPRYSALLSEVLGTRVQPDAHSLPEMLAENGVVEFPSAPPGLPPRVVGRAALTAHLKKAAEMIEFTDFSDVVKYEVVNAELVVVEFSGRGRSRSSGSPYNQRYVSFITTRAGHIIHMKEYSNPLAVLRTQRGEQFVESLFSTE